MRPAAAVSVMLFGQAWALAAGAFLAETLVTGIHYVLPSVMISLGAVYFATMPWHPSEQEGIP